MRVAVVYFPGMNCEHETVYALKNCGIPADIVRWNQGDRLLGYDGFVLPGGWSYEDRIRAGVIAAKDPVMDIIKEQAKAGKPVLGICNGAQILVETGLVPGKDRVALAPNQNPLIQGYYCTWVFVKALHTQSAFTSVLKEKIMPMPVAHGEGRFIANNPGLFKQLKDDGRLLFQYCTHDGLVLEDFPITPNASVLNCAGIMNKEGNVCALMPHPERATFGFQLHQYGAKNGFAPASGIFQSMKAFLEERK
ncbi:MAG: phosphoribosylformylglycinamidine synthase I [Nanoarchaeota archaeon]